MQKNVGGFDKSVRITAGIILILLGMLKVLPYGTVIAILGAFILLTGLMGFCMLYVPLGISTRK